MIRSSARRAFSTARMVKPPLAPPGGAMLLDLTSESRAPFAASKLWEQDPALIVVVRRPG